MNGYYPNLFLLYKPILKVRPNTLTAKSRKAIIIKPVKTLSFKSSITILSAIFYLLKILYT